MSKRTFGLVAVLCLIVFMALGCKKKVPVAPPPPPAAVKEVPPPPPPPKAPAISQFTAEPSTIERGQSTTLRWSTSETTEALIEPGIGVVQPTGIRQAFPSATTTYTLRAKGPGGAASATAMVTVTVPPPPAPPPPPPKKSLSERLTLEVQDAYFDFDKGDIREDARATLSKDADALKTIFSDFPDAAIAIEGHCDERGSAEYNLGLGDRRVTSAKDFLTQLGVPADRLKLISYGKERPQCTESNEECWQKNRRVHFGPGQ